MNYTIVFISIIILTIIICEINYILFKRKMKKRKIEIEKDWERFFKKMEEIELKNKKDLERFKMEIKIQQIEEL
jgi:pilus assembly protein TadC